METHGTRAIGMDQLPDHAFLCFANAGVSFVEGDILGALTSNVALGIICGLFLGKQLGVLRSPGQP